MERSKSLAKAGMRILVPAFCAFFAFALTVSFAPQAAKAIESDCKHVFDKPWKAPARVLEFPPNKNYGTIEIDVDWHPYEHPSKTVPARGKVTIPADCYITFLPSREFFLHPEVIARFAPNAFDCLQLEIITMEDSDDKLAANAISHIGHLKDLKVLIVDKSEIGDAAMAGVTKITNLEYFSAFLSAIDGSCLKDLCRLKKLRVLAIPSNMIKRQNFQYLPQFQLLEHLLVSNTGITDSEMKYIAACKKLKRIDFSKDTGVTDRAAPYLKQLKNLYDLAVDNTSMTTTGLMQLRELPLTQLIITRNKDALEHMRLLKAIFPRAKIHLRGGAKTVDDDTGKIFGEIR